MIDEFAREHRNARVSRLVSLPQKQLDALLVERGISLDDFEDVKTAVSGVGVVITPQDAIEWTFNRSEIPPQRYNTPKFPAFYTAATRETCIAEISYHLGVSIERGPRYFQFLEVSFDGEVLELCGHQAKHPEITSVTDSGYPFCQQVATAAREAGFQALSAPSARHDGVCIPIFNKSSISNPAVNGTARFATSEGSLVCDLF